MKKISFLKEEEPNVKRISAWILALLIALTLAGLRARTAGGSARRFPR